MIKNTIVFILTLLVLFINSNERKLKIGLCITATNKYIKFVEPLIQSARKFFLKNHQITFFVFSDTFFEHQKDTQVIYLKHKPWPLSTLQRFEAYYNNRDKFVYMDYIFACDADMLFMDKVSEEILSHRTAVLHPLFHDDDSAGKKEYETNEGSKAFIKNNSGQHYFAGGFFGGTRIEFINLIKHCAESIQEDFRKNFIAKWHDESHLNRYFVDNPPTLILSPSYCYPENYWKWIKDKPFLFKKIILALDKNYEIR